MAIPTAGVTLTVGVEDPKHAQYASDDDGHKCEEPEEFEEPFFECKPPIGYEFEEPFAQGLPHLFEGNKSTLFSRPDCPHYVHLYGKVFPRIQQVARSPSVSLSRITDARGFARVRIQLFVAFLLNMAAMDSMDIAAINPNPGKPSMNPVSDSGSGSFRY